MFCLWRSVIKVSLLVIAGLAIAGTECIAADYGVRMSQAVTAPARPASVLPMGSANPSLASAVDSSTAVSAHHNQSAEVGDKVTAPVTRAGFVRLPGHVLPALATATPMAAPTQREQNQLMTLTLTLKRDDQDGFDRYLKDVYDPQSKQYRHFLSPARVADRFGPSRQSYHSVLQDLRKRGFESVRVSRNRLTLTVRGKRGSVERAFAIHIGDYQYGGRSFYANDSDPALTAATFAHVQAIAGLSNLAAPKPTLQYFPANPAGQALWYALCMNEAVSGGSSALTGGLGIFFPAIIPELTVIALFLFLVPTPLPPPIGNTTAFSLFPQYFKCANQYNRAKGYSLIPGYDPPAPAWQGVDGTGQTIGLVEFDTYQPSDVVDYAALMGLPKTAANNVTAVHVAGGATPGPNQDEVLLDIADVLTAAPGAKIAVYDSPFTGPGTSFQGIFNAMINGGVDIISNSWAYCEDQTTLADVQSIDTILQSAAASGITVLSGAGDHGSTCLDGSANTVAVPADSPHITAVGGTSLTLGPGFSYVSETWWDGTAAPVPTGQGGFGVSKFFTRPTYQNGLSTAGMRSIPDVASDADPAHGVFICQASAGGCPTGALYGGTSSSTPSWAAYVALLNQAQGSKLGFLNPLIYPLANTAAFHNAPSMQADFAHVGLGSPNLSRLHQALTKQTTGPVSTAVSLVSAYLPTTYTFPHDLAGSLPLPDFADGSSRAYIVVNLADANGNTISGKSVTLSANAGSHAVITPQSGTTSTDGGTATFAVTDLTSELVTFTATDASDGVVLAQTPQIAFVVPIASSAGITANPPTVAADGSSAATITVTLKDALNRPTPGKSITIAGAGAHAVVTGPTPAVTDANGQIQFTATDDVNEAVTFTAVDATDGNLPIPGTATVTFSGAAASDCTSNPATGANGYAVTIFASGFPAGDFNFSNINFSGCPGAGNPYFLPSGSIWVPDFRSGDLYQLSSAGGAVSSANVLANLGSSVGTPIYGKDGNLYATRFATGIRFTTGDVIQIDPTTGVIVNELAMGLTCPNSLVSDPLSGDLFFDDQCTGAGSDNPSIWRVSNPGTNPTVSVYATLPGSGGQQQLVFAPDGTLYAVSGGSGQTILVAQVAGTNTPAPAAVATLTGITPDTGTIAIGQTTAAGSAKTLLIHVAGANGGALETIDITGGTPTVDTVLATGDIGAGIVGPDGCYYIGDHHVVYKLAPSSGACTLTPTNAAPSLSLSPASVPTNPAQGSAQTLTATLKNASAVSGVPVIFQVNGANPQIKLVPTNANGQAVLTYIARNSGTDTVIASANITAATQQTPAVAPARTKAAALPQTERPSVGISGGPAYAGMKSGPAAGQRFPAITATSPTTPCSASASTREGVASTNGASPGTVSLISNSVQLSWNAGPHVTFLALNAGPTTGAVNKAITVTASLTDISANPAAPVAGQTVSFTLGGSTCSATTAANGTANCQITPSQPGSGSLNAAFAGTSGLIGASAATGFNTFAAPTPPPTVTIAVSPTTVAAGSPATLTWSSTNATSCMASGSWSGTEPASGTQSVTPAANGSYTYALACSGAGGTVTASAVLSASLVAVTVTAKSGGGALSWYVLLALGLLVLLRFIAVGARGIPADRGANPARRLNVTIMTVVLALAAAHSVRAEQSATASYSPPQGQPTWLDPFYVGIRVGSMPVRLDSGKIDQGLSALGYGGVSAATDTSATAGTVYLGYEFTSHAALELGYTYRNSNAAYLNGTIPSTGALTPLLRDTTELIRGYGNIVSLSYSGRFEVAPRFFLKPRLGGFFWATKVTAVGPDDRTDDTHEGGGVTVGLTAAYRVWRGLELGINVDHFAAFPTILPPSTAVRSSGVSAADELNSLWRLS